MVLTDSAYRVKQQSDLGVCANQHTRKDGIRVDQSDGTSKMTKKKLELKDRSLYYCTVLLSTSSSTGIEPNLQVFDKIENSAALAV